jgi:hypothetical protein
MKTKKVKIVYIAYPTTGDVNQDLLHILGIYQSINKRYKNYIPFSPILDFLSLDISKKQSQKVLSNREEYFKNGMIDEFWLYGNDNDIFLKREIALAKRHHIPIVQKDNIDNGANRALNYNKFYKELNEEIKKFKNEK